MYTVSDNTPQSGCIQWSGVHITYQGVTYTITDGYTNYKYIYWLFSSPNNFTVSDTFPDLSDSDVMVFLNKDGIHITVPTASILDGDLIVPGSILADKLAANCITADQIAAGGIIAACLAANSVTADSIAANAIGAEAIAASVITGDKLVADTITAREIASHTITANEIAAGTITAAEIASGAITADKISGNTLTGVTIQTAASGSRIVMSSNTLQSYDSNNYQRIKMLGDGIHVMGYVVDSLKDGSSYAYDAGTITVGTIGGDVEYGIGISSSYEIDISASDLELAAPVNAQQGLTIAGAATISLINSNQLKVTNSNGYVAIAPNNSSYAHFYTDRPEYYFDHPIEVTTSVKIYGTSYYLNSSGLLNAATVYGNRIGGTSNHDQFYMGTGNTRIDTTSGLIRLFTSAAGSNDYGIKIETSGQVDFVCNSATNAYISGAGAIHGTSKSAITPTLDYGIVVTYSDESPNHIFNDRGRGQLDSNGQCIVTLDPIFLETVNTSNCDYHVQLTGIKSANIYLDDIQSEYFVVKGDPEKEFFWTVTAERYGFEGLRWNDADLDI